MIRYPHGPLRPCLPANGRSAVWLTDWTNSGHPVSPEPDASTGEASEISSAPKVDLARASMVLAFFMARGRITSRPSRVSVVTTAGPEARLPPDALGQWRYRYTLRDRHPSWQWRSGRSERDRSRLA